MRRHRHTRRRLQEPPGLDGEEPRLGPGQVERQRSAKREGSLEGNDVDAHTGMVGFAARGMTGG